jgi:hypothetical protein
MMMFMLPQRHVTSSSHGDGDGDTACLWGRCVRCCMVVVCFKMLALSSGGDVSS